MTRSNITDIEVVYVHDTARAVLVAIDETADPVWIPKSQIEMDPAEPIRGQTLIVTLPEALAIEKGLA